MKEKMILLKCNLLRTIHPNQRVHCQLSVDLSNHFAEKLVISLNKNRIKINKAKTKLTLTIYLSCMKCLLGRVPIFLYFIFENLKKLEYLPLDEDDLDVFYPIGSFCIYFSYLLSFFVFYYCNKKFQKVTDHKILSIYNQSKLYYISLLYYFEIFK